MTDSSHSHKVRGGREDIDAIKERLDIVSVAVSLGVTLRRQGRDLVGLSPFKAERTPSFTVDARKQLFYCFSTQQGGDVIDLVAKVRGLSRGDAIRQLKADAGIAELSDAERAAYAKARRAAAEKAEADAKAAKQSNVIRARHHWKSALPAAGTVVETYLRARGIDLDAIAALYGYRVPPTLRFHPAMAYRYGSGAQQVTHCGPAMVGAMADDPRHANGISGVHRTWLASCGGGKAGLPKAKLTLGEIWGSAGHLTPRHWHAVIGEGYETTLSVVGALAARGERCYALSAAALGNLSGAGLETSRRRRHPTIAGRWLPSEVPDPARPGLTLPASVTHVTVLADADGKDPLSTRALVLRAAAKFARAGKRVQIAWPEPGCDFNDMLQRGREVAA